MTTPTAMSPGETSDASEETARASLSEGVDGRPSGVWREAGYHVCSPLRLIVWRIAGFNELPRPDQGTLRICSGDGAIMLVLRWYITHMDPLSVMTTSTRVKISDIHVQPPSAFEVMCRKNTMCT